MATVAKNGTFFLKRGSGDPLSYAVIPGVKRFDPGSLTTEQIDATDFDSPGNFREFVAGFTEAGEGSFLVNYDPRDTIHVALRTSQFAGTVEKFQAGYDDETMTFDALVTGFSNPASVGELLEATVTIKMTGQPTFAETA